MTISFNLAFNPIWNSFDLVGRPIGGGTLKSFDSLNPDVPKLIYQDPAGEFPYPISGPGLGQGIAFDENGNAPGPFYFKFDTDNPESLYNLYLYDAQGNLVWNTLGILPTGGSGGGSITEGFDLNNLLENNVFYRNIGTLNTSSLLGTVIAPSAHEQLTVGNNGIDTAPYLPNANTLFIKNNTSATDSITFKNFLLGDSSFSTTDVTPPQFLNYTCTVAGSGETVKIIQLPITAKVQNLSNTTVTATVWVRSNSGAPTLSINSYQFFGSGGGGSASVISTLGSFTTTSGWVKYSVSGTIPNVAGKTLGVNANDALFFQLTLPLNTTSNIDIALPALYIGSIVPTFDFNTYDEINSIISAPKTGDMEYNFLPFPVSVGVNDRLGFLPFNGTSIGNASSGATGRANADTYFLFSYFWNNVSSPSGNGFAPVSGGLGASADSDFAANKTITLPNYNGRAVALFGNNGTTTYSLGQTTGSETHTLTISEMPAHNHPGSTVQSFTGAGSTNAPGASNATTGPSNFPLQIASQGGGNPFSVVQPIGFMAAYIKL